MPKVPTVVQTAGGEPVHLEEELGPDNCIHGEKGCTTCTRACPRFRAWETSADMHLFGRIRQPDEMAGIWRQLLLTRATDQAQHERIENQEREQKREHEIPCLSSREL